MPQPGLKEKTCVDCSKTYQPTSNVQKRCPECGAKASHKIPEIKKSQPAPKSPAVLKSPVILPAAKSPSYMEPFIDLLIHAGCDSIEFIARDISLSVRRVAK